MAMTERGVYVTDADDNPDVSEDEEYGEAVDPPFSPSLHSSEEHLEHEEDHADLRILNPAEQKIAHDLQCNIRHAPVRVPRHQNPFDENPAALETFQRVLGEVVQRKLVPEGLDVRPEEWDAEGYPEVVTLRAGFYSRKKRMEIILPTEIWYPRAVLWAQAVYVLTDVLTAQ
jgi:hypothetical protein